MVAVWQFEVSHRTPPNFGTSCMAHDTPTQQKAHHKGEASRTFWCPWRESDPRPLPYQGSALPLSHMGTKNGAG